MTRLAAIVLTVTLVLLPGGHGAAQEQFRIAFQRQPDEPTSLVLAGTLSNEGSRDVVDVWVAAEAPGDASSAGDSPSSAPCSAAGRT